ncbi:dolichyl-diphosphooligosaccharide--protein glycosyltransferase subunit DAD1 [Pelomyxa schiedti]|nr:dolichyl-diphosphooligosaccharide--protein glycosyltransferase subunit DAD1 [Pelomyxa schiedti]
MIRRIKSSDMVRVLSAFLSTYRAETTKDLLIIDAFLVFAAFTGVVVAAYCALVTTFPYNSFLSAFASCVGVFILTLCLRLQLKTEVFKITPERAFVDYLLCNLVLHLFVINFMG